MEGILKAVFGSTSDAIVAADAKGRVISWNPAAERIFGYSEEEILGQPLTRLMPEHLRTAHEAGLARVARTGESRIIGQTVKVTGLHKDGREFPIELSLATWVTNGLRFFSGIIRDVTERERTVETLAQSEERLRAILGSTQDAIVCADESGRVVLWNAAAERMFGQSEEDMLGKPLTGIIPERYRAAHEAGIRRLSMNEEPRLVGQTVELTALRDDGREFPIELSLGTWTIGERRYFSGIIRDITERKEAEKKILLANRALDEKNQELQALSAKLAKYLSKQVYDSIFTGRTDVRVESYRKNLTVFFSDVQGFTEITDSMEAEPLSDLLNRYLSEMSAIAHRYGGTIDKFIGDGIMIFFGDPETRGQKEDALACVRMALAMRRRMYELREEWLDQGVSRPLHVRIGINTGFCTVGNFGSENRLDYTIVGGEVNATARLEAAAQPDQILISHATYALVHDAIYCKPVGEITVKGIAHPLKTYEVIAAREDFASGAKPIADVCDGFRLMLDPIILSSEDRQRAKEVLRKALEVLNDLPEERGPDGMPAQAEP
jgi:PAS domain S-box-containing protein